MALADLLGLGATGSVADMLGLGLQRPALGGFQFNMPQAAPQAAQSVAAAQPQAPAYHQPSKFRNLLGAIGDALLVAHGQQPLYQQRMMQERENGALQGFLTSPDEAIARLMQVNPVEGIKLQQIMHPPSEVPDSAKVYEYEQKLPEGQRAAFEHVMQILHPGMMAPITLDPGATVQMPGAGDNLPSPASPEEAAKLPPGTRFRLPDGRIGTVPGGATASTPSPTFR